MNSRSITDLKPVPDHGQVSTALQQRLRAAQRTDVAKISSVRNAQVIPFANAARKQQLASRKARARDVLAQNPSLSSALSRIAETDSRATELEEAHLLNCLLEALANNSFQVYFQTQHCLRHGAIVGAEALLRLSDSDGRLHNTQALIDLAEQADLVGLIGRQMMIKACSEFATLRSEGHVQGRLALNVSTLELRHAGYADALLAAINEAGLQPNDVELEITESQSLDLPGLKLEQLFELSAAGVDLAVDDFGTGYATWGSVARLPINSVKLDRAMVAPLLHCERTRKLIGHLVSTGQGMGFRVIAEGVQNQEQQALLVGLGCTIGQGFGLSVPKSAQVLRG